MLPLSRHLSNVLSPKILATIAGCRSGRMGVQKRRANQMISFNNLALGAAGGLALLVLGSGIVQAASPAYCALYAREYTAQFATGSDAEAAAASEHRIQEQAYYQCLNMDVEPEFPQTSVYHGTGFDEILAGLGGPVEGVAEGDASAEDPLEETVAEPPAEKPRPTQVARKSGRGSGLEAWTPEWEAWCKQHFPKSFNPEDGTVKPYNEGRRFCH
jgi:hypothetical protein